MITFLKNNYKAIFVSIFFILIILFLRQCDSTKNWKSKYNANKNKNEQNIKALTDSLKAESTKNGKKSFVKAMASMSKEELEKAFPELAANLNNEFGEVKIVVKTKIVYVDTGGHTTGVITKLNKDNFKIDSKYYSKDSSVYINSTSTFLAKIDSSDNKIDVIISNGVTKFNLITFSTGFTTGIKETDGIYNIFLTPDSKNMTVTELKGADVSNLFVKDEGLAKRSKRISIGPYLGYGVVFGSGSQVYHGISAGVAIQYSLFRF